MRTLRARLTVWYIAIVTGTLILFAVLLWYDLGRENDAIQDADARERDEANRRRNTEG